MSGPCTHGSSTRRSRSSSRTQPACSRRPWPPAPRSASSSSRRGPAGGGHRDGRAGALLLQGADRRVHRRAPVAPAAPAQLRPAAATLEDFDGLDRYLASVGDDRGRGASGTRGHAALVALLQEVFEEQSDFELRPERLRGALERLERAGLAQAGEATIVATLHGVTISSPELALTRGLTIAQPHVLEGLPEAARGNRRSSTSRSTWWSVLSAGEGEPRRGDRPRPCGAQGPAARAAAVRRRPGDARRARVGARRRRQMGRTGARHRRAPARDAGGDRPSRRMSCAPSAISSPVARRTATSSPGRSGASSSAASARARSKR